MLYIIYKFDDYPLIKPIIDDIRKALPDTAVFMFEPDRTPKCWHWHAIRNLRKSRLVLVFKSLSEEEQAAGKHILWEIRKAEKLKTRMVAVCRDPDRHNLSPLQAIALADVTAFVKNEFHHKEDFTNV